MADATPKTDSITKTTVLPAGLRGEIGRSGTNTYGGYIRGEEYARDLQGRQALINYDIMRRTEAVIHTALQVYKAPLESANWTIQQASPDPIDVEMAAFVKRELMDREIDFPDVLREGMTCFDFGFSVFELVYSKDLVEFEGKQLHGLDKLASRKQLSILRWQTSDNLPGVTQLTPYADTSTKDIPMEKLVIFTNEKEGDNYEGISLLRFARKHFVLKDRLELMNAVALERMALGIPMVKKTGGNISVSPDAIEAVKNALRQIRVNEEAYIEVPDGLEVSMLDAGARQTKDILPTLNYEDTMMLLSVFASFLLLGTNGNSGSNALTSDLSKFLMNNLQSKARMLAKGWQSVINRLIDLNYSKVPNGYPKIKCTDISDEDVSVLATAVSTLIDAGALTPGRDVENRVRKPLDMPELSEEEWNQKQADKQAQAQQIANEAAKSAQHQQNQNPNTDPKQDPKNPKPPKNDPKNSTPKAKIKADALTRAATVETELFNLLAEG